MTFATKILIIRLSSIGDVVLTTPVVRCLKNQIEGDAEIHYLIWDRFADVVRFNPHIDKLHIYTGDFESTVKALHDEGFHYVIDLHKNLRSIRIRRRLKVLSFTFPKLNVQKWLLVNFKWNLLPDLHLVDRYFMAVKPLGIESDGKGCEVVVPVSEQIDVNSTFGLDSGQFVVLAIGGAHEGKKLSPEQLRTICSAISFPVVLIGGKDDVTAAEVIAQNLSHVVNACSQLSILGSASVISQAKVVVAHDSGMMHIAAAFERKIVSIWGATVPEFGMYPYKPHPESIMIAADHLKFRPTSKLGNRNSKREKRTTEEIDLSQVVKAVEKLWASS